MLWVSAIFTIFGVGLILTILVVALRGAAHAAQPHIWTNQWDRATYVSFAWQELGRGMFLGYLFALGMAPITAFFFLGQQHFWKNFFYFSLMMWALGAVIIYFVNVIPGLVGYALARGRSGRLQDWSLYGQILIVTAMSAPLIYALVTFLLPAAYDFFKLLVETFRVYARIFSQHGS